MLQCHLTLSLKLLFLTVQILRYVMRCC